MPKVGKPRPSTADSRDKLLACGQQLIERGGVRGLTVRGVAAQAQVNLGTFVYHFGTREQFITALLENWYAPIYARLQLTVDEQLPPLEKLRHFVQRFLAMVLENRRFVRALVLDLASGEVTVRPFALSLFGRHPQLLLRLIREAQEAGELQAGEPLQIAIFLIGATVMPSVWIGALPPEEMISPAAQVEIERLLLTPAAIERRFEWALRGLQPLSTPPGVRPKTRSGKRAPRSGSRP